MYITNKKKKTRLLNLFVLSLSIINFFKIITNYKLNLYFINHFVALKMFEFFVKALF